MGKMLTSRRTGLFARLSALICAIIFPLTAYVQSANTVNDTALLQRAQQISAWQITQTDPYIPVHQGREWFPPSTQVQGSPLYGNTELYQGTVYYEQTWYRNQLLQFDLSMGRLLLQPNGTGPWLILPLEKLGFFTLGTDSFFKANHLHQSQGLKANECYKIISSGEFPGILSTHKKKTSIPGTEFWDSWVSKDNYYLFDGKKYVQISREKDLYNLARPFQKLLHQQFSALNLHFSSDPEKCIEYTSLLLASKK